MTDDASLPVVISRRARATRYLVPVLASAVLLGGFVAVGCGDDKDDPAPSATSASSSTEPAGETPDDGNDDTGGVEVTDPALKVQQIAGLESPTQLVFLGPNELLVTEKTTGNVVHVRDGEVVGPVVQLKTNFADERGVLGITLHPQFAQNNFVYVYWTWTGEGEAPDGLFGEPSDDIEAVPENGNRIDRFTWNGSELTFDRNIIELPSKITDLTLDRRRGNHNGGVIKFGPDGKLYAVIGDQNVRGELTNVQDGPTIEESGIVASIIRLNDDGTAPEDNPFVAEGELAGKIYAYAIRNSFGFDFDPQGGALWAEVNGQAAYDEINRIERGENTGWIQIMGPRDRFDEYKSIELDTDRLLDNPSFPPSMLAANADDALARLVTLPGAVYNDPEFSWKYAIAPAGLGFIVGDALGADYAGDLLVGDVNTGSIYRFDLSEDRMSFDLQGGLADRVNDNDPDDVIGELADSLFATGILVATDIESGPDGTIWITSISGGAVYHITAGD